MSRKYVVVDSIVHFKHRYVIPKDELQALNPDAPVQLGWAEESVMAEEVNPVSQRMLDEMIVDVVELDEKMAYEYVRKENPQYGTLPDDLVEVMIKSWKDRN